MDFDSFPLDILDLELLDGLRSKDSVMTVPSSQRPEDSVVSVPSLRTADVSESAGSGWCALFVVARIIQPKAFLGKFVVSRFVALVQAAYAKVLAMALSEVRENNNAFRNHRDFDGSLATNTFFDQVTGSISHQLVHRMLKDNGLKMRKISLNILNTHIKDGSTLVVYGGLNMLFECISFPGFESAEKGPSNHAILVSNNRLQCINLVTSSEKAMTLRASKYISYANNKLAIGGYMRYISSAYLVQPDYDAH